jgi:signal transduction histidine kinase
VARGPVRPANLARLAAGAVAFACGLGAFAVARGSGQLTTYVGASDLAATMAVLAGLSLVGGGLVMSFARPTGWIGDLALLAGVTWFAPLWAGWRDGPPIVLSLGSLAAGLTFPLLVHLVLAYPDGRLRPRGVQVLVLAVYVEAAVVALGRGLFRDPFFDPKCWNNCTANVFLVASLPNVARWIDAADLWLTLTAAAALAAVCIWRLATATGPALRTLWPVLAGGIALAVAGMAHSIALARTPLENPSDPQFLAIFAMSCLAVIIIALSLPLAVFRDRIQRRSVARIVSELGEAPPPGSLEAALARAIGDPELRIAYWLPDSQRYVDGRGRPIDEPISTPRRAVTPLVRNGRRIALIAHGATFAQLEREVGAAVRLALENERLQAEVFAQLEDLRLSRLRIVETGDAERRRLERDLHDGAQQRLLALSYGFRLARATAEAEGHVEAATLLAAASDDVQVALDELRELAQGIYPAILTEAGLGSALASIAETAPVAVEIGEIVGERYPAPVESAAYLVLTEAIDDAARRGASYTVVSAPRHDERLVVTVEDDGSARTSTMIHLADRVGAVGGRLEIGPTMLRAEIPCA